MIQWTRKKSLPLSHWVGRVWCRPTRINKKTTEQTCSNYSFSSLIFTIHFIPSRQFINSICIYKSNPVFMHLSINNFFNFFISSSSSICEKFINFEKRNDTIEVTIRKSKQVQQWDHTLPRNLKKQPSATRLQQAAPQATNDSNKPFKRRQQQSSTAKSQILAEIVFPQSSIFFRRIKSRAYFWKSLVRGRPF